jgi:hypothetical protein
MGFTGSRIMSGTANSASEGYGLREAIHLRERTKTLCLAIHLAKGVAIVRKTASTMKYKLAMTMTADLTIRLTLIPAVAGDPIEPVGSGIWPPPQG